MPYGDYFCYCPLGICSTDCTYHTDGACSDATCTDRCEDWDERLVTIDAYGYVTPDVAAIQQKLVDVGPIVVSVGMLETYGGYWDGDIYRCEYDTGVNHAVVIVGFSGDALDGTGYWIVRNSWGMTGPFRDGTFLIDYDADCDFGLNAAQVTVTRDPTPTRVATIGSIHALFR